MKSGVNLTRFQGHSQGMKPEKAASKIRVIYSYQGNRKLSQLLEVAHLSNSRTGQMEQAPHGIVSYMVGHTWALCKATAQTPFLYLPGLGLWSFLLLGVIFSEAHLVLPHTAMVSVWFALSGGLTCIPVGIRGNKTGWEKHSKFIRKLQIKPFKKTQGQTWKIW